MSAIHEPPQSQSARIQRGPGPIRSVQALLTSAIDYAGLFPPASLSMPEAVANYAAYRSSSDAWALGRFIVPVARVEEFVASLSSHWPGRSREPWQLSAMASATDLPGEIAKVKAFNASHGTASVMDTVELKVSREGDIQEAGRVVGRYFVTYLEIPDAEEARTMRELLEAIKQVGCRAKFRAGGLKAEAFPEPIVMARFLEQCQAAGVRFKATAGLHHAIRARYPMTYEPNSETGVMHGFVNLLLAATFARAGWNAEQLADVLNEQSASAVQWDAEGVSWRGHRLTIAALASCRAEFMASFGSCSFKEPIHELKSLGWLSD